jgi:hypothetical protein
MFGKKEKITRSFLTATNAFLTEMLRAILKEMTGSEVYLTQVSFKAQKPRKPEDHERGEEYKYVNSVLTVEVSAFFTGIDSPRPRGREGIMPILPTATATFKLTNEANGWYSWKLISSRVKVENWPATGTIESCLSFLGHNDWFKAASKNLCVLAEELQHRGPSRMSEDQ